jgi:Flp pilus assembly protein TadG
MITSARIQSSFRSNTIRLSRHLLHLAADRAGTVAVTTALAFTGLAGVGGLSIDVGDWYMTRRAMQTAADAAAIAGARELFAGNDAGVVGAAMTDAGGNGFSNANGATVTATIAGDGQSITVNISKTANLMLSSLFLRNAPTIRVTSQAGLVGGGAPICMLTTNPTGAGVISFSGNNGTIQASRCALVEDSTSTNAIDAGNGNIISEQTCGPGGYTAGPNANLSPLPSTCSAMPDPLADLTPPSNANAPCNHTNSRPNGTVSLSPGVYCGGINVQGNSTVTFQPGIYILRDGGLSAKGGATLNGAGVGFFMTGSGTAVQLSKDDLSLGGNVNVNISAPTSGPLAGIAIYQDHSASTGTITNTIVGDGTVNFTGTLYFGNQNVVFTGNGTADGQAPFTAVIGNTVTYKGNGTLIFNANYTNTDVPPPPGMTLPRVALMQ